MSLISTRRNDYFVRLDQCCGVLNVISRYIVSVAIGMMLLATILQVIFRYILNAALTWPEELTVFLMSWTIFVGASVATREVSHIQVEIFVNLLRGRTKVIINLFAKLVVVVFLFFFLVSSWHVAILSAEFKSDALRISMFWSRLSLPVGGMLMLVQLVNLIIQDCLQLMVRGGTA